ncbi:MAG TPA: hypothetical protein VEP66_00420 [Myxococcales bacterium]|nr:hypothetical protein [Myxococcales bacterium]
MSAFILIPGAGGVAWYWHRLVPLLERAADFQRRVARERLDQGVDAIPGGHLVALSNPRGLADRLLAYERKLGE